MFLAHADLMRKRVPVSFAPMKPDFDSSPGASTPFSRLLPAIIVGGGCAVLYTAIARGLLGGMLVSYVPTLLLFGLGWLRGSRSAGVAIATCLITLLLLAPQMTPVYLALDAVPALLMLRLSLTYFAISGPNNRMTPHLVSAFSIGQILMALCLYASVILLMGAFTLSMNADATNSLPEPSAIALDIARMIVPLMQSAQAPEKLAAQLLPMLPWMLGVVLWMWVLLLWGLAALAHFLAGAIHIPAPRGFALQPFRVPIWLLAVLAIVGLSATSAVGWLAIAIKAAFFLLLLPYFLSGVAIILPKLPAGTPRRVGIAGLVLGLVIFPWAALIFIAIGLFHPLQSRSSNP